MTTLADYRGKWLVILFYPLDFTFVCPTELTAFSDAAEEFKKLNTELLGVSTDSVDVHAAWLRTPRKRGGIAGLSFPLIADQHKEMSAHYGALCLSRGFPLRGLYIIDPSGDLQQATLNNAAVGRDVKETLRLLQAFQFAAEHGEVCPAGWVPGAKTMSPSVDGSKAYFAGVEEADAFSKSIDDISSAEALDAELANHPKVIVDFYANWCGKCRQLSSRVDELQTATPGVRFVKVDVDSHPSIAQRFGASVLPTFVAFHKGKETARVVGYKPTLLHDEVSKLAKQ
jgi:thioredoxin